MVLMMSAMLDSGKMKRLLAGSIFAVAPVIYLAARVWLLRGKPAEAEVYVGFLVAYLTVLLVAITAWYAHSSYRAVLITRQTMEVLREDFAFRIRPELQFDSSQGPYYGQLGEVRYRIRCQVRKNPIRILSSRAWIRCTVHERRFEFDNRRFVGGPFPEAMYLESELVFRPDCGEKERRCNYVLGVGVDATDYYGLRNTRVTLQPDGTVEVRPSDLTGG